MSHNLSAQFISALCTHFTSAHTLDGQTWDIKLSPQVYPQTLPNFRAFIIAKGPLLRRHPFSLKTP